MTETNINMKRAFDLNMQNEPKTEINSISNLLEITSLILPTEFEPLPNMSEVFELKFVFYEYKSLTKDEIICRELFFKSVDEIPTYHYTICSISQNIFIVRNNIKRINLKRKGWIRMNSVYLSQQ